MAKEAEEVAPVQEPTRFVVRAKNPTFNGKTLGVRFNDGEAILEKLTVSKLDRTVQELAWLFKNDFHYEVEAVG